VSGKILFNDEPSPAEQAAQKWHDEHHTTGRSCWCCCSGCKAENPHDADARRAALLDIEQRIRESQRSIRYPVPVPSEPPPLPKSRREYPRVRTTTR
jgi:hypothetical protein